MLACKKMQSPYIPDIAIDNFDQNHVNNSEWKDAEAVKESELQLRRDSVQKLFEVYYFNKLEVKAPAPGPNPNSITTKATTLGNTTTNGNNDDIVLLRGAGAQLDENDNDDDEDVKD